MNNLQEKLVDIAQAITLLHNGGVGVLPTDTVYGLVTRAQDEAAATRLYTLKDRHHKPGTIIAASPEQLLKLGVSKNLLNQVAHLWPNPLSIILPIGSNLAYLHQGLGDIAIRVVNDHQIRKLLEQTGPLLTSSANKPGEPGSVTITEAWNYFHDEVDFYVDGGNLSNRLPSTIARARDDGKLEVLRQGAYFIPDAYTSGKN